MRDDDENAAGDRSHSEAEATVGYGRPPKATRFPKGRSGNPRGRPKGSRRDVPYDAVLGQKVVIRENGVERRLTAAEAFLLHLAKKGLEGEGASARQAMAAIEGAREKRLIAEPLTFNTIYIALVTPGSVSDAIERLRMARRLDRYRETRRIVLEPWIVEAALARLGSRRLTREQQEVVVKATRSPAKVRWPDWWEATASARPSS